MMITNCDLIIKNGKVFEKNKFKKNHIVIKNGKIFKLTKNIKSFKSKKIINADKKIVIPGIIDIHFHVGFRSGCLHKTDVFLERR